MFNKKIKSELLVLKKDVGVYLDSCHEEIRQVKESLKEVQKECFNLKYPYGRVSMESSLHDVIFPMYKICFEYKYQQCATYPTNPWMLILRYKIRHINNQIYLRLQYVDHKTEAIKHGKTFIVVGDKLVEIDANIDFQTCDYDSKNSRL